MKVSCEIIRDLLPLYAEGLASADSAALVEEHIASCEECNMALEKTRAGGEVPVDSNTLPLKALRAALRKKKILTIIASITLTLTVAAIVIGYLTTPVYFPYSEDIVTLTEKADGTLLASFGEGVSGYEMHTVDLGAIEEGDGLACFITAWDSVWNRMTKKGSTESIVLSPGGETVSRVYYSSYDENPDTLIYGADTESVVYTLPRLVLAYYLVIAMIGIAGCGIALLLLRKNKRAKSVMTKILLIPASYLVAHFCVKGLSSASYSATHDFFTILLVALPLYFTLLLLIKICNAKISPPSV